MRTKTAPGMLIAQPKQNFRAREPQIFEQISCELCEFLNSSSYLLRSDVVFFLRSRTKRRQQKQRDGSNYDDQTSDWHMNLPHGLRERSSTIQHSSSRETLNPKYLTSRSARF